MYQLVDSMDIIESRPPIDTQRTPIHSLTIFYKFNTGRGPCLALSWHLRILNQLSEWNVNRSYLP